jgi:hypothetical protein
MLRTKTKLAIGAAVAAVAAAGGTYAYAGGGDGDGGAKGPGARHARQAALRHLGGGEVNAVERDNEKGATWEVEVTKTDGSTVDVRLGADYSVIVVDGDREDGGQDGPDTGGGS